MQPQRLYEVASCMNPKETAVVSSGSIANRHPLRGEVSEEEGGKVGVETIHKPIDFYHAMLKPEPIPFWVLLECVELNWGRVEQKSRWMDQGKVRQWKDGMEQVEWKPAWAAFPAGPWMTPCFDLRLPQSSHRCQPWVDPPKHCIVNKRPAWKRVTG
jgi:hypothetical protein